MTLAAKEIRAEMRVRNNRLWHLIFDRWGSVSACCLELGLSQAEVGRFLNLKAHPLRKNGKYKATCIALSDHFRVLPEDLFPLAIYELEKTESSAEVGIDEIPFHECTLIEAPDTLGAFDDNFAQRQLVEKLLFLVTPRQRTFLELRFGIGGCDAHTADQIGELHHMSGANVDMIIDKAIRRIRTVASARMALREFFEDTTLTADPLGKHKAKATEIRNLLDELEGSAGHAIDIIRNADPDRARILEQLLGVNGQRVHSGAEVMRSLLMSKYRDKSRQTVLLQAKETLCHSRCIIEILSEPHNRELLRAAAAYAPGYKESLRNALLVMWR